MNLRADVPGPVSTNPFPRSMLAPSNWPTATTSPLSSMATDAQFSLNVPPICFAQSLVPALSHAPITAS